MKKTWVLGTIAAAISCVAATATANAATTIGQSPPVAGTVQPSCTSQGTFLDVMQASNTTGPSYTVPAGGGVITSWRTTTAAGRNRVAGPSRVRRLHHVEERALRRAARLDGAGNRR